MAEEKTGPLVIRCRENGPYVISLESASGYGSIRIVDHEGREFSLPTDKPLLALCRCGASANKPFCDGAHKQTGFTVPSAGG